MPGLRTLVLCSSFLISGLLRSAFQEPMVLLTEAPDLATSLARLSEVRSAGMQVRVIAGPGAFIGTVENEDQGTALRRLGTRMEMACAM